ncbi:unnamed protein product [Paramecium sonneborni]|uniref:Malectin domain-containing protein n=1 Tax=Paramecium sonneborni TaxID=65129 RepID=A0A8S1LBG0_9CILI|nr:unnamed protein product [Paramecium sonneborni]
MINILFISLISFVNTLSLKQVLLAIDCGGQESFNSNEGYLYQDDQYFSGDSRVSDYTYNDVALAGISYTFNPRVYFTERHGNSFDYSIPINKNGQYTIILQFVELYFENEGERQFDVFVGTKKILNNLSIIDSKHQKGSAKEVFIYIEIKDDKVFYDNEECNKGFMNGKLKIGFRKGAADLPKIDGIVIVKGHNAGEEEKNYLIDNWEVMQEENRKKEAELKRAELEAQNMIVPDLVEEDQGEGFFSFLLSPIGIGIITFGLAVFAFLIFTGEKEEENNKKKNKKDKKDKKK